MMDSHTSSVTERLDKVSSDIHRSAITQTKLSGKVDELLDFKASVMGTVRATTAKVVGVASGVLVLLAVAIIVVIQLVNKQ